MTMHDNQVTRFVYFYKVISLHHLQTKFDIKVIKIPSLQSGFVIGSMKIEIMNYLSLKWSQIVNFRSGMHGSPVAGFVYIFQLIVWTDRPNK